MPCKLLVALIAGGLFGLLGARADVCSCTYGGEKGVVSDKAKELAQRSPISVAQYPLHNATIMWDVDKVQSLLKDKKSLADSLDKEGRTPLHLVLLSSSYPPKDVQFKLAELLLAAGAKPDTPFPKSATGRDGITPLMWVSLRGQYAFAQKLLKYGADATAKDSAGATALLQAVNCDFQLSTDAGSAATAQVLLAAGADPLAKTAKGNTPVKATYGLDKDCKLETGCIDTCKVMQAANEAALAKKSMRPNGPIPTPSFLDFEKQQPKCCSSPTQSLSQCCA